MSDCPYDSYITSSWREKMLLITRTVPTVDPQALQSRHTRATHERQIVRCGETCVYGCSYCYVEKTKMEEAVERTDLNGSAAESNKAAKFAVGDDHLSEDEPNMSNDAVSVHTILLSNPLGPCLIGVAGGSASGKSTVCQKIVDALAHNSVDKNIRRRIEIISQDCFYRPLTDAQNNAALKGQFDFDHPDAFDEDLMIETLSTMMAGYPVKVTEYDFINHRLDTRQTRWVRPADVIIFEGILIFYFKKIREMFSMKLFVDTDPDTRLARRVSRDMKERARPLDLILHQYMLYVKPAFEEFCLPTKKYADIIIPRGADNLVAIDLIVQHVQDLLRHGKTPDVTHSSSSLHAVDSTGSFKLSEDLKYSSVH